MANTFLSESIVVRWNVQSFCDWLNYNYVDFKNRVIENLYYFGLFLVLFIRITSGQLARIYGRQWNNVSAVVS